jgi:hypothetical protein
MYVASTLWKRTLNVYTCQKLILDWAWDAFISFFIQHIECVTLSTNAVFPRNYTKYKCTRVFAIALVGLGMLLVQRLINMYNVFYLKLKLKLKFNQILKLKLKLKLKSKVKLKIKFKLKFKRKRKLKLKFKFKFKPILKFKAATRRINTWNTYYNMYTQYYIKLIVFFICLFRHLKWAPPSCWIQPWIKSEFRVDFGPK